MAYEAIWTATGLIHSAEEFWGDMTVDPYAFVCHECSLASRLCSYNEYNKKRPYFKQVDGHAADCPLNETPGRPKPNPDQPSKRRIIDELFLRPLGEDGEEPSSPDPSGPGDPNGPGGPGGPGSPSGHRTAGGVRAVVREYERTPSLRTHPLRLAGCPGNTYGSVFRGLVWAARESLVDLRIYYGSLRFGTPTVERSDGFEVTFVQGASGDPSRKFRLFVRTTGWKASEIAAIRHEMKLAFAKTRSAHQNKMKGGARDEEPWVFFAGKPSQEDPLLFITDHPRAVCSFRRVHRKLDGEPDPAPQRNQGQRQRVKATLPGPTSDPPKPEETPQPVAVSGQGETTRYREEEREIEEADYPLVQETTAARSAFDGLRVLFVRVRHWFGRG